MAAGARLVEYAIGLGGRRLRWLWRHIGIGRKGTLCTRADACEQRKNLDPTHF